VRRWHRLIGAALIVPGVAGLWAAVGSGSAAARPNATGSPITFGAIAELTGPEANPSVAAGLQAYVANWDAHGGYKGHRVDVIVKDDELNPSLAETEARSLVQTDGVVGMVPVNSLVDALINNPYYISEGIGVLGGGTPTSYDPKIDFPIESLKSSSGFVPPMKYAVEHGAKKIALLVPPLGALLQPAIDASKAYLATTSATLVVPPSFPSDPTAADLDAVLAQLKSEGVDAVLGLFQGPSAELLIQEADRQSYGPSNGIKYLFGNNLDAPQFAAPINGAYSVTQAYPLSDTSNPNVKTALAVLKGHVPTLDGFVSVGYDYGALLKEVLDKVKGPVTRQSFIKAMEATTSASVPLSPLKLDLAKPDKDLEGGAIVKSENGRWVAVSPYIASKY